MERVPLRIGGIEVYGLPEEDELKPQAGGDHRGIGRPPTLTTFDFDGGIPSDDLPATKGPQDLALEFEDIWTTAVPEEIHLHALEGHYITDPRTNLDYGTPEGIKAMARRMHELRSEQVYPQWYIDQRRKLEGNLAFSKLTLPAKDFTKRVHDACLVLGEAPNQYLNIKRFGIVRNPQTRELAQFGTYSPETPLYDIESGLFHSHWLLTLTQTEKLKGFDPEVEDGFRNAWRNTFLQSYGKEPQFLI